MVDYRGGSRKPLTSYTYLLDSCPAFLNCSTLARRQNDVLTSIATTPVQKPLKNMSTATAASYLPDSQVITLKRDFAAFHDPKNIRGFRGADEIAFFFHEWIHYLHNVSTVQGLSAFANVVHLWSVFRRTIGPDGLSKGSASLSDELALNAEQKIRFMTAIRTPRMNGLSPSTQMGAIEFRSVTKRSQQIAGTEFETSIICCEIQVRGADGRTAAHVIEAGTHEILESVAFMLEERLTRKLGSIAKLPSVDPYLLVRGIATHVVPGISDIDIILSALAALQNTDPPSVLLEILLGVRASAETGGNPSLFLCERLIDVLTGCEEWVESTLQEVERQFPVDEPMARAVKSTVRTIRQNFAHRRVSPFLEIEIVNRIGGNPATLDEVIKTYGECAVIQQRPGFLDDVERDLMYDFIVDPNYDDELSFGRRMMHAAFRFIALHCAQAKILPTAELRLGERNKCPFFTSCSYPLRKANPEICAIQPWLASERCSEELCWYGRAVRTLAPRPLPAVQ